MPVKTKPAPQPAIGESGSKILTVPVRDLYRDPVVNPREPGAAWIEARSGPRYSRAKLGVLTASYRDGTDGRKAGLAVLDGWNRRELVKRNESPDALVECEIFMGLSLAEEAERFLGLNDSRKVHAVPRFKAQVTAGEIVPSQVAQIVADAGFTIADVRDTGILVCVAELTRMHSRDKDKCGTARKPQALKRTLEALKTAYRPDDPAFYKRNEAATHVALIGGVGHLYTFWGDAADTTRIARTLAEWNGGANGLLQQANGAHDTVPGLNTAGRAVAYLVARAYNKGLSTSALPVPFNK